MFDFSLYANDKDDLAEGVQNAITGTDGVHVTHMLYADDFTLTAYDPNALQTAVLNFGSLCTEEAPDQKHSEVRG
eukprot:scaffold251772_cov21-Tisochrysis_lutea.AAC.1